MWCRQNSMECPFSKEGCVFAYGFYFCFLEFLLQSKKSRVIKKNATQYRAARRKMRRELPHMIRSHPQKSRANGSIYGKRDHLFARCK